MDAAIEARIKARLARDNQTGISSYGGMGLDSCSPAEKTLRLQEIAYMQKRGKRIEDVLNNM